MRWKANNDNGEDKASKEAEGAKKISNKTGSSKEAGEERGWGRIKGRVLPSSVYLL
jgi:hypothetical protein